MYQRLIKKHSMARTDMNASQEKMGRHVGHFVLSGLFLFL